MTPRPPIAAVTFVAIALLLVVIEYLEPNRDPHLLATLAIGTTGSMVVAYAFTERKSNERAAASILLLLSIVHSVVLWALPS